MPNATTLVATLINVLRNVANSVIWTACAFGSKYHVLVVHLHCGSEEIARRAYFTRSKTYLGRVIRDIGRRIADDDALEELFARELSVARRVLAQDR